jgi:hypothetical protein
LTGGRALSAASGAADADGLGIALTRGLALRAWRDAPTRFREDANHEEDLVLGGYRDRLVVELAQNAADAARRAGVPGRLRLALHTTSDPALAGFGEAHAAARGRGAVLAVANDGAPLDAAGVRALATLRASAKRDEPHDASATGAPVGRFGVGFAAVLQVSDEPALISRTGGVRFDLNEAREEVRRLARDTPELGVELRRREGRVPVLRLPYRCEGAPPVGYDTVVVLPLRDDNAERLVRRLLTEIDDALLLTLPALSEVSVDLDGSGRTLRSRWHGDADRGEGCVITESGPRGRVTRRWRTERRTLELEPELLADRPVEERAHRLATVTWAVRLADATRDISDVAGTDATADALAMLGWSEGDDADATNDVGLPDDRSGVADDSGAADSGAADSGARGSDNADVDKVELAGAPRAELPRSMRVVHAPTPTDEPLSLPALLIGDFPLDSTRRHLARGRLLDRLIDVAADAYAALLANWPSPLSPALLDLAPGPVGVGEFDAALGHAISARLPDTSFLPTADPTVRQRPRDAIALDVTEPGAGALPAPEPLVETLALILANLLPAGWDTRPAVLTRLGVRRLRLAEAIDALGASRELSTAYEPAWWNRLYQALADTPSVNGQFAREELGTLPVPLADGRVVRGPRGVLLPTSGIDAAVLRPLDLRIVHPEAAHALLIRLGARHAEPRAVLADPAVAAAIDAAYDAPDEASGPERVAEAVLSLVTAAMPSADERFGLDALLLPDADGGFTPAGELVLPGSPLADVVGDELGSVAAELVDRWGPEVLLVAGVLGTFDVVRADDVVFDGLPEPGDAVEALVDAHPELDLDGIEGWLRHVEAACRDAAGEPNAFAAAAPPTAAEVFAVRDLDLVAADRWERALALLAASPLRAAVLTPTQVRTGESARDVPSYAAWWLGQHEVLDGHRPIDLLLPRDATQVLPTSDDLTGLYEPLPDHIAETGPDREFLRAIGVRTNVTELLATPEGPDELLERFVVRADQLDPRRIAGWYTALAGVALARVTPPHRVCALVREPAGRVSTRVVPSEEALVADTPDLLPLLVDRPYLPVAAHAAASLAELLDLDLASDALGGRVVSDGDTLAVPAIVRVLLPAAPERYVEHETLLVTDDERAEDEAAIELEWRVVDGVVHAATSDGLARGLAWVCGRWSARHAVAALLLDPSSAQVFAAEADFED